jgi:hypothetical protein
MAVSIVCYVLMILCTSDGDVDSSDFESSIEDYGNIQALIDAHPAPPNDDDDDEDNED